MGKIKVGVVGCGFVASKWHIPSFLRLKESVAVQAVCDLNKSLAASVASEFNVPKTYSNLTDMLRKEELDIVDVCTPPHVHAPIAVEALEKGCHVLLEKPMALRVSDCDQMIAAAQKHGSKLCVVHNELFRPPLLKARELVARGDIGRLIGMQWCRFTHRAEYMSLDDHWVHRLPGGVLGETGPHAVYTSLAFLKSIKDVDIYAKKTLESGEGASFDYFHAVLEGDKAISSVIISHSSDNFVADVSVFGTKGILKMDLQSMLLTRYELKETRLLALARSSLSSAFQTIKGVAMNAAKAVFARDTLMRARGHAVEIEKFVDSVVNDQQPPVTAEEGRETVRIMEIIVEKLNQRYSSKGNENC